MKIPQRQDQVSLNSPQVATGRAVQPVAEAMGSSYVDTMKGLSKNLQDLSDLSFKLYENKMEGQQDRLKLYTNQRTKQYEQELSLATTEEQIKDLFDTYKSDIENAGNELLGSERYQSWYSKEGGAVVAGAVYTGNLASAQLQIKQNKEVIEDASIQYNELAFTAKSEEERNKYFKEWEDLLTRYVENGTLSKAEKQDQQRKFNYTFAKAIVTQDIEIDPEKTMKKLREDKNYLPILSSSERLQYAQQAEYLSGSRAGTTKSSRVKQTAEWWHAMYWNEDPDINEQRKVHDEAQKIYDIFSNKQDTARKMMAKVLGIEEKEVTFEDVESVRKLMDATSNREDQDRALAFEDTFGSIKEKQQGLLYYKEEDSKGKEKLVFPKGQALVDSFNQGKFKDSFSNVSQAVDLFNSYSALFNDPQTKTFATKTKNYNEINGQMNQMATLLVKGLRSDKEILESTEEWSVNFSEALKGLFNAIESSNADGLEEEKMVLFVKSFLQQAQGFSTNGIRDAFSGQVSEDVAAKTVNATYNALIHARVQDPHNYIKYFYKNYSNIKDKSLAKKATEGIFDIASSVLNPDLSKVSQRMYRPMDIGSMLSGAKYTGGNK